MDLAWLPTDVDRLSSCGSCKVAGRPRWNPGHTDHGSDLCHRPAGHRYQTTDRLLALSHRPPLEIECDSVDAGVQADHRYQRDPEVSDLEETIEQFVFHILHVTFPFRNRPLADEILPSEDRREKHRHRNQPRQTDDDRDLLSGPPLPVHRWNFNRTEAIGRDAKDGVYGAEAGGVIDGKPEVAECLAEGPVLAGQKVDGVEGHRDGTD